MIFIQWKPSFYVDTNRTLTFTCPMHGPPLHIIHVTCEHLITYAINFHFLLVIISKMHSIISSSKLLENKERRRLGAK